MHIHHFALQQKRIETRSKIEDENVREIQHSTEYDHFGDLSRNIFRSDILSCETRCFNESTSTNYIPNSSPNLNCNYKYRNIY